MNNFNEQFKVNFGHNVSGANMANISAQILGYSAVILFFVGHAIESKIYRYMKEHLQETEESLGRPAPDGMEYLQRGWRGQSFGFLFPSGLDLLWFMISVAMGHRMKALRHIMQFYLLISTAGLLCFLFAIHFST